MPTTIKIPVICGKCGVSSDKLREADYEFIVHIGMCPNCDHTYTELLNNQDKDSDEK